MNSLRQMWRNFKRWEKLGVAIVLSMAIVVIVISLLGIVGVLSTKFSNCISVPLLGAIVLINGIVLWDKNREVAIFLIGSSIFVFLGAIFMVITYLISL